MDIKLITKTIEVEVFITSDGTEFEDEDNARTYERKLSAEKIFGLLHQKLICLIYSSLFDMILNKGWPYIISYIVHPKAQISADKSHSSPNHISGGLCVGVYNLWRKRWVPLLIINEDEPKSLKSEDEDEFDESFFRSHSS